MLDRPTSVFASAGLWLRLEWRHAIGTPFLRHLASSRYAIHAPRVGWIARPGSAEDRLKKWLDRVGLTRVLLWCSALLTLLIAWNMYDVTLPRWRWILIVPVTYALGALGIARHFGQMERPTKLAWFAAIFFLIPVFVQFAVSTGLADMIERSALPH